MPAGTPDRLVSEAVRGQADRLVSLWAPGDPGPDLVVDAPPAGSAPDFTVAVAGRGPGVLIVRDLSGTLGAGQLLASDTFNRADGALGATNGDGALDPLVWGQESPTGELEVVSNRLGHVGSLPATAEVQFAHVDLGRDDARVSGSLTFSSGRAHGIVAGRAVDDENLLAVQIARYGATDRIDIYKEVADSVTVLASDNPAGLTLGQTYAVDVLFDGDRIEVRVDGTVRVTHVLSAADAAVFAGRSRFGVGVAVRAATTSDDGGSRWDDVEFRDV